MNATKARQLTAQVQERQRAESEALKSTEAIEARRVVERALPEAIKKLDEDIARTIERGYSSYSFTREDTVSGRALVWAMEKHYRAMGFTVSTNSEVVDYGDSAAPCRVHEYCLTLVW